MQIVVVIVYALFLSTLSLRRATVLALCSCGGASDFYPRSPCGERPTVDSSSVCSSNFYPRSPCGERPGERAGIKPIFSISIHALLAESDNIIDSNCNLTQKFLSTLSLRRATTSSTVIVILRKNFYPRSPCGERPPY